MTEQLLPQFEHQALEDDIVGLTGEIRKNKESSESGSLTGEKLLKKSMQSFIAANNGPVVSPTNLQNPLPEYLSEASPEFKIQIEYLLDIAFHHGLLKADRKARKASPFVLDAFHDALVKKIYPHLKERGVLS